MRRTHPPVIALLALLALAFGVASPSAAHAADEGFRFWGYYQLKGSSWTFSQKGSGQTTPADGSVEGWRYATAAGKDVRMPRGTVTFDQVCSATPAKEGTKRVAVVIDYGRPADAKAGNPKAPRAGCAQVPTKATGTQALAAVGAVRSAQGMVCGVDSWPASGCAEPVKTVSSAAKAKDEKVTITMPAADDKGSQDEKSGVSGWLVAGIAVLVLLLALAVLALMRRRRAIERA